MSSSSTSEKVSNQQSTSNDEISAMDTARLAQTVSTGVYSISPEMFEKLYLTPKVPHTGDNIKRFANPTPMGFVGFVVSAMTFSMILMGWGGASSSYAVAGMFIFVGPLLLILTTIMEWIMGNFLPMMVCSLFAVFWLSFGFLQLPTLGLASAYSETGSAVEGAASVQYNAAIALYLTVWGFAFITFFIFTLKTNMVFAMIFGFGSAATWLLSGAYWKVASGDYIMAGHLVKAGGALLFIVGLLGWYMTFVMMAAETRLTTSLPVGDLSHFWPKTDVEMGKAEREA